MKTNVPAVLLATAAVAVPLSTAARTFSECGCNAFLGDGLVLTKEDISSDKRADAFFRFYCSAEEEVALKTYEKHRQLNFFIPDTLDLDLSSDDKGSALRKWRSSECDISDRQVSQDVLRSTIEEVANESALQGANQCYETCQRQGGLYCTITPASSLEAIFTANWMQPPNTNDVTFPKVTGGDIIGGRFKSSGFGSLYPISNGTEVPITGISAALVRDDVGVAITLRLQTSKGSCAPTLAPLDATYDVRFEITGTGKKQAEVRQDSGLISIGDDSSCTENNVARTTPICLGAGATATGYTGPSVTSARNGSASVAVGSPTLDCGNLVLQYSDSGRNLVGDCKGNGWVSASTTIVGTRSEPWTAPPYILERKVSVNAGAGTAVLSTYPPASLAGTSEMQWTYSIKIEGVTPQMTLQTIELGSSSPSYGSFESQIDPNGQLVLRIKPQ